MPGRPPRLTRQLDGTAVAAHRHGRRRRAPLALLIAAAAVATPIAAVVVAPSAAYAATTYAPGTPVVDSITSPAGCSGSTCAPWNTSQGDSSATACPQSDLLPTYTPCTDDYGGVPNLAVYPAAGASTTAGASPYPSGVAGSPGPLDDYCGSGSNAAEGTSSSVSRQPAGTTLPFAPAYFPKIVRNADGSLTGYFDERPKDADESLVAATSTDGGQEWTYDSQALEENPGYCPTADTTDDGEGHAFVTTIDGSDYVYTLERAAGDDTGVGLLVHAIDPTTSNPINGLPTVEETGIDPDDFASSGVNLTNGTPETISFTQPVGSGPEGLYAATTGSPFVDLTQTPVPTQSSIITCTGVGTQSLTGCTTPSGTTVDVAAGDLIEQVVATIASNLAPTAPATACSSGSTTPTTSGTGSLPCTVPPGPNNTIATGGLYGFGLTVANPNNVTMNIFNNNAPERAYIDGVAVYCDNANAWPTTKIENCSTGGGGSTTLTVHSGDPVTFDPIVPANQTGYSAVQQTTGLVAPDGIVGILPSYPGTPAGATDFMYTEKILNYFVVGATTTGSSSATFADIAATSGSHALDGDLEFWPGTGATSSAPPDLPTNISSSNPVTVFIGDNTLASRSTPVDVSVPVTCTGLSLDTPSTGSGGLATDELTGCAAQNPTSNPATDTSGASQWSSSDVYSSNSYIGAPGAALVPGTTLALTGEGSTTSAKHLFKNNEDLSILRVAYTTNGINFSDSDLTDYGVITGADNNGATSGATGGNDVDPTDCTTSNASSVSGYTDINNPCSQAEPSGGLNAYASAGTADATEMRWVGSAGSIITNPDGSYGLFLSGSWAGDGDSDAFNQIYYSTSTNGENWSVPTSVISTDYTFSASIAQQGTSNPLGVSAYYSGRAYGPSVVQNPNGTLTMVFAGYRLPKPITAAGTTLGTGSQQYTIGADDPALYRNIMSVTLASTSSPTVGTSTALGASTTSPVVGQPVTYTATVSVPSPGTGTPTGTVTFSGDSGTLCSDVTLSDTSPDTASCTTTYSAVGGDSVTAAYSGDGNYSSSSSSPATSVDIGQAQTTTSVQPNPNSAVTGESVTYTATVAPVSPGAGTPTGSVTFTGTNGTLCSDVALDQGSPDTASCTYDEAVAGTDTVTAAYSGDYNFASSNSLGSPVDEQVSQDGTATTVTAQPSNPVTGETVTLTATVSANSPGTGTPTGDVTFAGEAGTLCGGVALNQGSPDTASCTATYSATTTDMVTASYSGDSNYGSSQSAATTVDVGDAATTTTVTASTPSAVAGESVTYTATVAPAPPGSGTPTGTVEFESDGSPIAACATESLGQGSPDTATCTVDEALVGTDAVTAYYGGDSNYASSDSSASPLDEPITQDATTTALSWQPASPVTGEEVVLTATVSANTPGSGTPTGTVTFSDAGGTLCSAVPLSDTATDTATCDATPATSGSWTVTATYSGDTNYQGSSDSPSIAVGPASTQTSVTGHPSSAVTGQSVTYTATVSVVAPGAGEPTGTVAFTDSSGPVSSCQSQALSAASPPTASCTVVEAAAGSDSVTADYAGDPNFSASSNAGSPYEETVSDDPTTTTLASSNASPVTGQSLTLTATVAANSPGTGTPTGTVEFESGGTAISGCGAVTLASGSAACTTSLTKGTHALSAVYSGDPNYQGSTGTLSQSVSGAASTVTVQSSANPSQDGQGVVFTATVAPVSPGTGTPTGTVTFALSDPAPTRGPGSLPALTCSGAGGKTVTLSGGTATCNVGNLQASQSPATVVATYSGDANFSSSTSSKLTQVVGRGSTTVTVTNSGNATLVTGNAAKFTATVAALSPASGTPTGTVTFLITGADGSTVECTSPSVTLNKSTSQAICRIPGWRLVGASSPYTVSATFSGDSYFDSSTGTLTQAVGVLTSRTVLSGVTGSVTAASPLTWTATVKTPAYGPAPTGTVTFVITPTTGTAPTCSGGDAVSLSSGQAICQLSSGLATTGSPYTVTATYSGDGNYATSSSTTKTVRAK